jgi:hypothetical protein
MQYHIYDIIHMILHMIYYDIKVIYYDIIGIYDIIVQMAAFVRQLSPSGSSRLLRLCCVSGISSRPSCAPGVLPESCRV